MCVRVCMPACLSESICVYVCVYMCVHVHAYVCECACGCLCSSSNECRSKGVMKEKANLGKMSTLSKRDVCLNITLHCQWENAEFSGYLAIHPGVKSLSLTF